MRMNTDNTHTPSYFFYVYRIAVQFSVSREPSEILDDFFLCCNFIAGTLSKKVQFVPIVRMRAYECWQYSYEIQIFYLLLRGSPNRKHKGFTLFSRYLSGFL